MDVLHASSKILAGADDGEILGVHCVGPHASELVHAGGAVVAHGGDLQYSVEAVFNDPTMGEAYEYAAYEALDRIRERREGNFWSLRATAPRGPGRSSRLAVSTGL